MLLVYNPRVNIIFSCLSMKKKEKKEENLEKKEVTINLDTLGVPIAIIIAALIIAVVVWATNTKTNDTNVDSGNSENEVQNENENDTNSEDTTTPPTTTATASIDNDPYVGDRSTATVAIVEFSDPTCYYCNRHADETFPEIKKNYIDTGKAIYVFKEWPRGSNGALTYEISEAGMCVFDQKGSDVFVQYHEQAFDITEESGIKTLASSLGVDMDAFDKCMSEGKFVSDLEADEAEGTKAGVTGTPGFVIGKLDENGNVTGTFLGGAYPYSTFQSTLDELLK